MRIPNCFLTEYYDSKAEFIVACRLFSCVTAHTYVSANGYEISIKQSTISESTGLSVTTVKRVLKRLEVKGLITHKYRKSNILGLQGAYHYSLKAYSLTQNYFYINSSLFKKALSSEEIYVYAWFCKLKCNDIARFYQSLNDLCKITGYKKSKILASIKTLIEHKLIRKQRKKTYCGDYTDNTYFVIIRTTGKIRKKKKAYSRRLSSTKIAINVTILNNSYIVTSNMVFVNTFFEESEKIFLLRGGG